jgi:hypothetical protein
MPNVTIYHNPACGTSRNALALIRNAGVEPTVVEYLKAPPDRATLETLIARMGARPRDLLREKGTPYAELDLGAPHWTDDCPRRKPAPDPVHIALGKIGVTPESAIGVGDRTEDVLAYRAAGVYAIGAGWNAKLESRGEWDQVLSEPAHLL